MCDVRVRPLLGVMALSCLVFAVWGAGRVAKTARGAGGPTIALDLYAAGFTEPVDIANSGIPGDDRLFIVERAGRIRVVGPGGVVRATPFLDIEARVDSGASEEGLLGLVFHPGYGANGYFYVHYIETVGGIRRSRISRFTVTADPNIADPNSERHILSAVQPDWNHNAGDLAFGPDGYLYIPMGDGGSGGDPDNNAQNPGRLLGKILRIDVDGGAPVAPDCDPGGNYTIPGDNPFIGVGGACDEIWHLGVRNPWRASFDAATGDYYIGDVGQGDKEEISFWAAGTPAGLNYGWRCYEGTEPENTSGCGPAGSYVAPLAEHDHDEGHRAITGGFVYRGADYPALNGYYLYTDYATGWWWTLRRVDGQWENHFIGDFDNWSYVSYGTDVDEELYVVDYSGQIYRVRLAGAGVPEVGYLPVILGD